MVIYSGFSHEKWWFSIVMLTFTRGYQNVPNDLFEDSSPHPCSPLPLFTSLWISLYLCLFIHLWISLVVSISISFPYLFSLLISLLISLGLSLCLSRLPYGPWPHAPRGWEWHPLHHRWFASCPQGPAGCWSQRSWTPCLARPSRRRRTWRGAKARPGWCARFWKKVENVPVCLPQKMRLTWGLIPYTTDFWTGIHVFYPTPIISILKVLLFLMYLSISAYPQLANQGTKDKFYSPRCHWSPFQAQRGPSPRSSGHPQCSLTSTRRKTTRKHEMFIDVWRG